MRRLIPALGVLLLLVATAGCDESPPPAAVAPAATEHALSRQEQFLGRIRQAAAGNNVIRDARMNRNDELGVVLNTQVKLEQVRPLLTSLLREMRDEFPNRPLRVIAYTPKGQPLATMQYEPTAPPDSNVTYRPNF